MLLYPGPTSRWFVWAMVLQAIWIGCPIGCVCADGTYKFFCDAHEASPNRDLGANGMAGNCCHRRQASPRKASHDGCPDHEGVSEAPGEGCTRLATATVLLPDPSLSHSSFDQGSALRTPAPGSASTLSVLEAFLTPQPTEGATGPPGKLLLRLHRLLI